MLRVNGAGRVLSGGAGGHMGPGGVSMMAFDGEFELDVEVREEAQKAFNFTGCSFSREIDINVGTQTTINFINCEFENDVVIRIRGVAESANFFGCNFKPNTTVDLEALDFEYYPDIIDCESDDSAHFLVPEEATQEISWKLPGLLFAAVGIAAVAKEMLQVKAQSEEKVHVEIR